MTWIPLALLGVELALRAGRWRDRVVPWCATGVALSQMFGAWVGEGWLYALFLVAAYVGYRTIFGGGEFDRALRERLPTGAATALVVIGLGAALGAAGVLPRLAVNAETTLAGGDYARLGREGVLNPPWRPGELPVRLLAEGYDHRATALGGAVAVLALLAPFIAGRRFAVPFFAALTLVALALPLEETAMHRIAYLIPHYQALHEHDPWRAVALAAIGPAVLAGAAVDALPAWRGRWRLLPLVVAPLAVMLVVAVTQRETEWAIGPAPLLAAVAATALLVLVLIAPRSPDTRRLGAGIARLPPVLLLILVVVQPVGLEATGSWLGWPRDPSWERHWRPDPVVARTLAAEMGTEDPGGAGEFLRERLAAAGPFRYVGYGGTGHPDDPPRQGSYVSRRFEPTVQALLVNGRPMVLGLYEVQGYNPTQLARYAEFVAAANGWRQNYHFAYLFPGGTGSPLLDLLDVRYVLLDASLPRDREDVTRLTAGKAEVFRTDLVAVYEAERPPPHAWIVHDVQAVARGEALPLLASRTVDPYRTALVEGAVPEVAPPASGEDESARVTRYEPEAVTIAAMATAPGLLVVSEVYAAGLARLRRRRAGADPADAPRPARGPAPGRRARRRAALRAARAPARAAGQRPRLGRAPACRARQGASARPSVRGVAGTPPRCRDRRRPPPRSPVTRAARSSRHGGRTPDRPCWSTSLRRSSGRPERSVERSRAKRRLPRRRRLRP